MNTLFGLVLLGACAYVYAPPPAEDVIISCLCIPCPKGYDIQNVPGQCCGVCKPKPGGSTAVCPPVCSGIFGHCAELCSSSSCGPNEMCCSNGCGHVCTQPIRVQANPNGLTTTCTGVDNVVYQVGDVFTGPAAAYDGCQYCQCMSSGNVVCKPAIQGGPKN